MHEVGKGTGTEQAVGGKIPCRGGLLGLRGTPPPVKVGQMPLWVGVGMEWGAERGVKPAAGGWGWGGGAG